MKAININNKLDEEEEFESKILEISADNYRDIIVNILWWVEKNKVSMTAVWMKNKITWHKIRIREEWNNVVIEEKRKIETVEKNIKWATEIKHKNKWKTFIEEVILWETDWYIQLNKSVKTRISFILENWVKIEFDKYSDLDWMEIPEFAEIESTKYEEILETAKLLWFNENALKNWNAWELASYYKDKFAIN